MMLRTFLLFSIFLLPLSVHLAPTYQRILLVGNSITLSSPAPHLEWPGYWGMAASQADRDYAHQVQLMLAARQGFVPKIAFVRADIHRWPVAPLLEFGAGTVAEFAPDLVIVQMGDNAALDVPYEVWETAYQEIAAWAPGARFLALGKWGGRPGNAQEEYIRQAAQAASMEYVSIRDLHIAENEARQHANNAVAWHPNDAGMQAIAQRVVERRPRWLPWVTSGVDGGTVPPEKQESR